MRNLVLIFGLIIIWSSSYAQQEGRKYYFREVGWSIVLHPDFIILDSISDKALKDRGTKAVEEADNMDLGVSKTKSLISANKGKNYFNCNITSYNPKIDGNYQTSTKELKNIVYKTFRDQIPGSIIDTASTIMIIDGLEFDRFQVSININDKVLLHVNTLFKYYKGIDLQINYLTLDQLTLEQIEKMLSESKFDK